MYRCFTHEPRYHLDPNKQKDGFFEKVKLHKNELIIENFENIYENLFKYDFSIFSKIRFS